MAIAEHQRFHQTTNVDREHFALLTTTYPEVVRDSVNLSSRSLRERHERSASQPELCGDEASVQELPPKIERLSNQLQKTEREGANRSLRIRSLVQKIYDESRQIYGSYKMAELMQNNGTDSNRDAQLILWV